MSSVADSSERRDVVIADYGMGNLGSVANMIRYVGGTAIISRSADDIAHATRLILPGVGNFAYGMEQLNQLGLIDSLNSARDGGSQILGICLGMQLMTQWCEEGRCDGLGWFDVRTVRFPREFGVSKRLPVPHMGWNQVDAGEGATHFDSVPEPSRFYFVHSYYVDGADSDICLATTEYGDTRFASAIGKDNVVGVQFHPEKSHKFGIAYLRDFIWR